MPNDPVMLLSFVNTQLRDNYNSLEELCANYNVSYDEICVRLESIDYKYNAELNRFI